MTDIYNRNLHRTVLLCSFGTSDQVQKTVQTLVLFHLLTLSGASFSDHRYKPPTLGSLVFFPTLFCTFHLHSRQHQARLAARFQERVGFSFCKTIYSGVEERRWWTLNALKTEAAAIFARRFQSHSCGLYMYLDAQDFPHTRRNIMPKRVLYWLGRFLCFHMAKGKMLPTFPQEKCGGLVPHRESCRRTGPFCQLSWLIRETWCCCFFVSEE